ncbi:unnamed protein product [Ectocarpus sp. 12 AP-2014]
MNEVILATAGYDHKIHFWEPPSGECRSTLRFSDSQVNSLKITPDKQYLAAAGNPHVRLFEINSQTASALRSYDGHATNVTDVGFQKDAKWMYTGSEDGAIKIWDLRAPSCQRNYDVGSAVTTVALHPNQAELISGDIDGKIKVWDLTANKSHEIATDGKNHPIQSLSMATNASVLVGANNKGTVFVLSPGGDTKARGHCFKKTKEIKAHDTYLLKCVLSPNVEKLVTTSADKTIKVWDTKTWTHQRTLVQHQRWVWDAVFSADSYYIITASSDQSAKLWDVRSGSCILSYMKHDNAVTCVALNDTTPS